MKELLRRYIDVIFKEEMIKIIIKKIDEMLIFIYYNNFLLKNFKFLFIELYLINNMRIREYTRIVFSISIIILNLLKIRKYIIIKISQSFNYLI